jgi:hypothetical protein
MVLWCPLFLCRVEPHRAAVRAGNYYRRPSEVFVKLSVRTAGFWMLATFLLTAAPAAAQTPAAELQVAYQALHVPGDWMTNGINFDLAANMGSAVSLVFELGGTRESVTVAGIDVSRSTTNFGAGVRFSGRGSGVTPYFQALVGGLRGKGTLAAGNVSVNASTTKFMIQPGVGVNVKVAGRLGIFGAGDYRRVFLDKATYGESGQNEFRVLLGIRIDF